MKSFLKDESAQVFVEFILALAIMITVVVLFASGFKKILLKIWGFYTRMIAAPCPGCTPSTSWNLK